MISYRANKDWPYHVSAGGVVVDGGKVLLLGRAIEPSGQPGGWHLPKGTVEPEEPLEAAAIREIEEEADVHAKAIVYLGALSRTYQLKGVNYDKTTHYFLCEFVAESETGMDEEHDEREWVSFADALDRLSQMPKGEEIILSRAKKYLDEAK